MKKLLAIIILVAVVFGAWLALSGRGGTEDVEVAPATSRPDPSNATFQFEDGPVTLENGRASTSIGSDSFIQTETVLTDKIAYGDINSDKKNDAAAIIIQDSGGSGIFVYIAAYVSGNVQYKGSNAVFIGDRVSPQSLSINANGIIILSYLERSPSEPMAATPTVTATKEYVYRGGKLEER